MEEVPTPTENLAAMAGVEACLANAHAALVEAAVHARTAGLWALGRALEETARQVMAWRELMGWLRR